MLICAIKPALLFGILAATVGCYLPGLTGHFIFDDGVNIRINPFLEIGNLDFSTLWQAASSGSAGLLKRPISMASFAVNHYFSGMDPYYFKAANLAIHLVNGVLVFVFARLLLGLHLRVRRAADDNAAAWVAIAVAAIWLLHPFNLTGVLYVVQRMSSLAALFTLAGLALYLNGRKKLLDGNRSGFAAIAAALYVVTPLAALCKETGVLLPPLILATEAILLRWDAPDPRDRRMLAAIVGLSVAAPLLLGLFYVLKNPEIILGGYAWRDFSLTERLMTEARVLWFYLHMIVLPSMTEMGLHHDDILISRSLFAPWTTLPAIAGLLLLAGGAFVLRNKQPVITFGIAFFFVGHALESTIIPLEIAFEHRNYLPMFGILLPLAHYTLTPRLHLSSVRVRRVAFLLLVILFAGLTASRAQQWGDTLQMRTLEVERHPHSVRAHTDLAALYDHLPPTSREDAVDLYSKAIFHYQQAADNAPTSIAGLLGILAVNAERRLPVDEASLEELERRIATVSFGPPNKNSLIGAVRDIASGYFAVNAEIVVRLYCAALSNPRLTGDHRSQIIAEFGNLPPEIRPKTELLK
ncbi:MAG: pilus assembly protein PilF [Nitrosomonadales bacterium]|nr:pilus assembly protein PilF [Nitrosomonadales bacterium]